METVALRLPQCGCKHVCMMPRMCLREIERRQRARDLARLGLSEVDVERAERRKRGIYD